jgi:hypothetical protein
MGPAEEQLDPSPPFGRRWRVVAAIVALAFTFGVGAGAGYRWRGEPAPAPEPTASHQLTRANVRATDGRCATQDGTQLWLGIEIENYSPGAVVLDEVAVNLPLGGFNLDRTLWAVCGALSPPSGGSPELPVGGTMWLSVILDVLVDCPTPLPVLFRLSYTDAAGTTVELDIGGFVDLGSVSYHGCATV